MATHEQRVKVFEDTLAWIDSDADLAASVASAKANTTVYYEDDYPAFDASRAKNTVITVTGERSFQAAARLRAESANARIAVMNFANAFHPGGGVKKGSSAQEESLCRTSTLYPLIYRRSLRDTFYKHHYDLNTPKASDSLIYTEGVVICKSDEDLPKRLPKSGWVKVDVITVAAPDLRNKPNQHALLVNGGTTMNDAELFGYHVKRAMHILTCAAAKGADILVLGAFGCGAFQNNPEVVARAYKIALAEFPKVFQKVVFAVYCPPSGSVNYEAFAKAFAQPEIPAASESGSLSSSVDVANATKPSIFDGILSLEDALSHDSFGTFVAEGAHKGTSDDPIPLPYVSYTDTVNSLVWEVYTFDNNNPDYGLKDYLDILDRYGYKDVPPQTIDVSNVNAQCLMAMFMWLIRGERFCDGLILETLESGIVQRWIGRLRELREASLSGEVFSQQGRK